MNGQGITAVQTEANTAQEIMKREILVVATGVCPKCAMFKRSGKLSCCARTASWYKECGRPGDSAFKHTWDEGLKACKKAGRSSSANSEVNQVLTKQVSTSIWITGVQNENYFVTSTNDAPVVSCKSYDQLSYMCTFSNLLVVLAYVHAWIYS